VLSAGSYLAFVELPEDPCVSIESNQGGGAGQGQGAGNTGGQAPEQTSGAGPQPSTDSAAAEQAASDLFVDVKKGFEGGSTRD
jgi:hypothetical protein